MGIDLSKPGEPDEQRASSQGALSPAPSGGAVVARRESRELRREHRGRDDRDREERDAEERELEALGIDDSRLTPIGLRLPGGRFLPEGGVQTLRFAWMAAWIVCFATGWTGVALVVMFAWIGANGAYENHRRELRKRRKREINALKVELAGGAPAALPHRAAGRGRPPALAAAAPAPDPVPAVPPVSEAERSLVRTVRRVDTSGRFERTDLVLVHEVADLLGPLLEHAAERGADVRVRHDLETLALEHLPRTVDDFLVLPADFARTHVSSSGTTPAQELRNQLGLLLEGCTALRDAVHDADVTRQQEQSRFLEAKFRRSDLDL